MPFRFLLTSARNTSVLSSAYSSRRGGDKANYNGYSSLSFSNLSPDWIARPLFADLQSVILDGMRAIEGDSAQVV
jgi:hypothetical protein